MAFYTHIFKSLRVFLYSYLIVREWYENGEFDNYSTIVVLGSVSCARGARIAMHHSGKVVLYCKELPCNHKYKMKSIKWIICEKKMPKKMNEYNSIYFPII